MELTAGEGATRVECRWQLSLIRSSRKRACTGGFSSSSSTGYAPKLEIGTSLMEAYIKTRLPPPTHHNAKHSCHIARPSSAPRPPLCRRSYSLPTTRCCTHLRFTNQQYRRSRVVDALSTRGHVAKPVLCQGVVWFMLQNKGRNRRLVLTRRGQLHDVTL